MPNPENKPIIAVDIDEVLVPHFPGLISWYNSEYGTNLTLEHNHPKDSRPWGTENITQAIKRVHKFFDTPAFLNPTPYDDALEALRKLSERYVLVVVTARDTIVEKVTREWLETHFEELFQEAHFTASYNLEGKSQTKADVCLALGAGYLIDDSLDNITGVAEVGIRGLLYGHYPWNQSDRLHEGITRVKDWQEVLEYFDGKD